MSEARVKKGRADWQQPLGEMEKALAKSLAQVREKQKAFEDYLLSSRGHEEAGANWPRALEDSCKRVQELQAMADRARDKVAEVDAVLAEGELALKEWLEMTDAGRGKLAN